MYIILYSDKIVPLGYFGKCQNQSLEKVIIGVPLYEIEALFLACCVFRCDDFDAALLTSESHRGVAHLAVSLAGPDDLIDQEAVEQDDEKERYERDEHGVDEEVVDRDEVVVPAEFGGAEEDAVHAQDVLLDVFALEELGNGVDAGEDVEQDDGEGGALASAVLDAVEGLADVEIAVDGEGERDPDGEGLGGGHDGHDVVEEDLCQELRMH